MTEPIANAPVDFSLLAFAGNALTVGATSTWSHTVAMEKLVDPFLTVTKDQALDAAKKTARSLYQNAAEQTPRFLDDAVAKAILPKQLMYSGIGVAAGTLFFDTPEHYRRMMAHEESQGAFAANLTYSLGKNAVASYATQQVLTQMAARGVISTGAKFGTSLVTTAVAGMFPSQSMLISAYANTVGKELVTKGAQSAFKSAAWLPFGTGLLLSAGINVAEFALKTTTATTEEEKVTARNNLASNLASTAAAGAISGCIFIAAGTVGLPVLVAAGVASVVVGGMASYIVNDYIEDQGGDIGSIF